MKKMSKIKFGILLPRDNFDSIVKYALTAEKLGFDSIWMADHVFLPFEALTTLSAISIKTTVIRLGTSVIDANRRNPAVLADITATLDAISGGRFILGIGKGVWNEPSYGFTLKRPVSRMSEIIEIVKKFWTEHEVSYRGRFFNYKNASIASKPLQKPHPPIWIAGFGPRMIKTAGKFGNGFITQNIPPQLYKEDLKNVRGWAKKVGRDPSRIEAIFAAPMAISSERHKALALIESDARRLLVRRANFPYFITKRLGYQTTWMKPEDVPISAINESFIFGAPDDCISRIERYLKAGVTYLIALPLMPAGVESLKLYAEKVMSYLVEK